MQRGGIFAGSPVSLFRNTLRPAFLQVAYSASRDSPRRTTHPQTQGDGIGKNDRVRYWFKHHQFCLKHAWDVD